MSEQYPHDEFDDLPEDAPIGVHRKPRSPWQTVLPFLVVLLVVPLLAWGATVLVKGNSSADADDTQSDTVAAPVEKEPQSQAVPVPPVETDGPTGAPEDPNETEEPATEEPAEPEIPVDLQANIAVLNASGIEGLAGSVAGQLVDAGFINAWAGNAAESQTMENTVFYRDASMLTTAQRVGEITGIGNLVENAAATGESGIAVLLRTQP